MSIINFKITVFCSVNKPLVGIITANDLVTILKHTHRNIIHWQLRAFPQFNNCGLAVAITADDGNLKGRCSCKGCFFQPPPPVSQCTWQGNNKSITRLNYREEINGRGGELVCE